MTPNARRPENLALIYQEALTAIERLRANRDSVNDAPAFRHHNKEALKAATNTALAAGYNADDAKFATFAVVAFLDESVLNSQNPIFGDWLKKPLQEELFNTFIAGETFYQNLQQMLGRSDSQDLGDLIEVYYLCMLLGFRGKYRAGDPGGLGQILNMTREKLNRIRGKFPGMSPQWQLPSNEKAAGSSDPWVRKLIWIAAACAAVTLILFIVYMVVLHSGLQIARAGGPDSGVAPVAAAAAVINRGASV